MTVINDEQSWAVTEFADAELGAVRRSERLIEIATVLAQEPSASFPQAAGQPSMLKASYRFFNNSAIEPDEILASHVQATSDRITDVPLVLAVQDTTELDWTHHPKTTELGPLSGKNHQGLLAHTTLAMTPERVPLGLIAQQVWARDADEIGKSATRRSRPIEEKESYKWLASLGAAIEISESHPKTHFISIGDREADIYDLFLVERPANVDPLVRAAWNRRVDHEEKYLWETVKAFAVATTITLEIPRRHDQAARRATLSLRFGPVTLRPPKHRQTENLPPIQVWAVFALEENPPDGVKPVEWLLLTTCAVLTVEAAIDCLDWYTCRWGIEILHKVLKSGCRIEARQLENASRLKRALPIFSVVAWRILYATMLARTLPDAKATAILETEEWQALYCRIHHTPVLPEEVPTLSQAVRWIAQLGGFVGRKSDGQPGVTVLWKGFMALTYLTAMYLIFRPTPLE